MMLLWVRHFILLSQKRVNKLYKYWTCGGLKISL